MAFWICSPNPGILPLLEAISLPDPCAWIMVQCRYIVGACMFMNTHTTYTCLLAICSLSSALQDIFISLVLLSVICTGQDNFIPWSCCLSSMRCIFSSWSSALHKTSSSPGSCVVPFTKLVLFFHVSYLINCSRKFACKASLVSSNYWRLYNKVQLDEWILLGMFEGTCQHLMCVHEAMCCDFVGHQHMSSMWQLFMGTLRITL